MASKAAERRAKEEARERYLEALEAFQEWCAGNGLPFTWGMVQAMAGFRERWDGRDDEPDGAGEAGAPSPARGGGRNGGAAVPKVQAVQADRSVSQAEQSEERAGEVELVQGVRSCGAAAMAAGPGNRRPRAESRALAARVMELLGQGYRAADVAREVGVTRSRVSQIRYGWKGTKVIA